MFKRRAPQVIDKNAQIRGEFSFAGDLVVEGNIEGKIAPQDKKSRLTIASSARITTDNLAAHTIEIFGTIHAQTISAQKLIVHPGSVVTGQLQAQSLEIKSGAKFDGHVRIEAAASPVVAPTASAEGSASVARERLLSAVAGSDNVRRGEYVE